MTGFRRITWMVAATQLAALLFAGMLHDHGQRSDLDCCGSLCEVASPAAVESAAAHDGHRHCSHGTRAEDAHAQCDHAAPSKASPRASAAAAGTVVTIELPCGPHHCLACQYLALISVGVPHAATVIEQPLCVAAVSCPSSAAFSTTPRGYSSRGPPADWATLATS